MTAPISHTVINPRTGKPAYVIVNYVQAREERDERRRQEAAKAKPERK